MGLGNKTKICIFRVQSIASQYILTLLTTPTISLMLALRMM